MIHRLLMGAAILVGLGLGGFLVAASGLIPIKASSGHWPVTAWFLKFSMHRSVATHSLGIDPPQTLDDPAMILRGAAHYDLGCRSCHGRPGERMPRIPRAMTPPPPSLPERMGAWSNAELFSMVKHGVKFTGMPGWPALGRDDEVWDVVAFLRRMPELSSADYERLAGGGVSMPPAVDAMAIRGETARVANQACVKCHAADGSGGEQRAFPTIAGQRYEYMEKTLQAYARGDRHSGVMGPIAAALKDEVMAELSRHYARQVPHAPPATEEVDSGAVERGRILAERGLPEKRIPSCLECHSTSGARSRPEYPLLGGQPRWYLQNQLELFKADKRGGSEYAHIMKLVASHLSKEQMSDLAAYFSREQLPAAAAGSPTR